MMYRFVVCALLRGLPHFLVRAMHCGSSKALALKPTFLHRSESASTHTDQQELNFGDISE